MSNLNTTQKICTQITITLICLLLLSGFASAGDKRTPPPDLGKMSGLEAEAFYLGVNAVIWGYPVVLFEELMRGRTLPDIVKKGNPQSAVNQFGFMRQLRGPEYKQIATMPSLLQTSVVSRWSCRCQRWALNAITAFSSGIPTVTPSTM
jgi:hypothetical protein